MQLIQRNERYAIFTGHIKLEMLKILIVVILTVQCLRQMTSSLALPETGGGSTTSAGNLATLPACAVSLLFLNAYMIHSYIAAKLFWAIDKQPR